jgi:hypothetical protein
MHRCVAIFQFHTCTALSLFYTDQNLNNLETYGCCQKKSAMNLIGIHRAKLPYPKTECEGWDSNPRTPTRLGPQPSAFDLAWLPSLLCHYKKGVYLIKSYAHSSFRIFLEIYENKHQISSPKPRFNPE